MSHFSNYIKERTNKSIIENEFGFLTYYFTDMGCYIEDMYVDRDFRLMGHAKEMTDSVVEIAKKKGCTKIFCSVIPSTSGSTEANKALMAYGFRLDSATNNFILYIKDI